MDFLALAKKRYACRKYLDRKVEPEKLAAVLEAGRVAPTGANRQPQRLIVVESPEGMERLARCTRDFGAPAAVVVCADTSEVWTRKYDGKRIGDIDASIVTDHMMLAAASLGLDTLWICMFKPEAVREEFGLPDTVEPVNILLIGYGADAPPRPTVMRRCASRSKRRSSTSGSDRSADPHPQRTKIPVRQHAVPGFFIFRACFSFMPPSRRLPRLRYAPRRPGCGSSSPDRRRRRSARPRGFSTG